MRRLGLIYDYIQPDDTSLAPAYERYQAAFAALSSRDRAADERIAMAATRAIPHGLRTLEQIERH